MPDSTNSSICPTPSQAWVGGFQMNHETPIPRAHDLRNMDLEVCRGKVTVAFWPRSDKRLGSDSRLVLKCVWSFEQWLIPHLFQKSKESTFAKQPQTRRHSPSGKCHNLQLRFGKKVATHRGMTYGISGCAWGKGTAKLKQIFTIWRNKITPPNYRGDKNWWT